MERMPVKKKAAAKATTKTPTPKAEPAKKKAAVVKKKAAAKVAVPEKKSTPAKVTTSPTTAKTSSAEGFTQFTPYQEKKGEPYMSEPMRAHFHAILEAWKHELMEEVDRTVHHMQDEAANFPDPNDRATQESEFTMELRTRDRERKLIKKIEESLNLLDEGEYGYCESCGDEIGVRRLEARPTATLCIECKTLDEIREKQRG
jgi:DnaK suppressor protein